MLLSLDLIHPITFSIGLREGEYGHIVKHWRFNFFTLSFEKFDTWIEALFIIIIILSSLNSWSIKFCLSFAIKLTKLLESCVMLLDLNQEYLFFNNSDREIATAWSWELRKYSFKPSLFPVVTPDMFRIRVKLIHPNKFIMIISKKLLNITDFPEESNLLGW